MQVGRSLKTETESSAQLDYAGDRDQGELGLANSYQWA